ncbi:MAG: carbon-nitrogen hydrolase family protein [Synergistaceae bacterium]|nr:carbon-nitrogen hydrolase family protein [Synergistaceae bacterium]
MVNVAAIQMDVWEDMESNYQRSLAFMEQAAARGAQVTAFPEGHLSRYIAQYPGLDAQKYAITMDHPYIKGFCDAAKKLHMITSISPSLLIDGKIYSSNVLISEEGEILASVAKNHIVRTEHFYEQDYYTPGNDGFQVVNTSVGRIGIVVCYDRHYPESYRTCALKNADFVITPAGNEKAEPADIFEWEIRINAFANSMYILMVNRTGLEGQMDFCGRSIFASPRGFVVSQADDTEQILMAQLDLDKIDEIRTNANYMKLRRPEVFELG